MQVVETVDGLRHALAKFRQAGQSIGFVPTMGNLHEGHIALIRQAHQLSDQVVASIFVNPMQFGAGEDFDSYPRTHQQDIDKLKAASCSLLFLPSVETIYPLPVEQQTRVEVPGLSDVLCGKSRPGHFVGVATVVNKLLNLVQPDLAVFGEKDYQQLLVIRRMVNELCMPVEIIGAPIVREADGLAMSSRNGYLDSAARQLAPQLFRQLQQLAGQLQDGERDFDKLEQDTSAQLDELGFTTDYVAIRRADDLQLPNQNDLDGQEERPEWQERKDRELVILAAAFIGKTRLIDNLPVMLSS